MLLGLTRLQARTLDLNLTGAEAKEHPGSATDAKRRARLTFTFTLKTLHFSQLRQASASDRLLSVHFVLLLHLRTS